MMICTPSSWTQANFEAFCLFNMRIAIVLRDSFGWMNSWRRGCSKAPPAPMMRTDIDMTRMSKLGFDISMEMRICDEN